MIAHADLVAPMTSRQRELVRSTWEYILPMSEVAVEFFYTRLFKLDPSLRFFLENDMRAQKRRLIPGFCLLIDHLDDRENLQEATRRLGRSDILYSVKYSAPDTVRAALLHMLREMLGPIYTADTEDAWIAAYEVFEPILFGAKTARD